MVHLSMDDAKNASDDRGNKCKRKEDPTSLLLGQNSQKDLTFRTTPSMSQIVDLSEPEPIPYHESDMFGPMSSTPHNFDLLESIDFTSSNNNYSKAKEALKKKRPFDLAFNLPPRPTNSSFLQNAFKRKQVSSPSPSTSLSDLYSATPSPPPCTPPPCLYLHHTRSRIPYASITPKDQTPRVHPTSLITPPPSTHAKKASPSLTHYHPGVDSATTPAPIRRVHLNPHKFVPRTSLPRLSHRKKILTTLYFHLPNISDPIPTTLHSCMSLLKLFSFASGACTLFNQEHTIEAVRMRLEWLDGEKEILVQREDSESFMRVLKAINGAPCWGQMGEGKCRVEVEV